HRDLRALARLERGELAFECGALLGAERAGGIGDARLQPRHRYLGRGGERAQGERERRQQRAPQPAVHYFAPVAPLAGASNSTFGGLAISRSFSTVKLGLVLKPNTMAVRLLGNDRTVTL